MHSKQVAVFAAACGGQRIIITRRVVSFVQKPMRCSINRTRSAERQGDSLEIESASTSKS